MATDGPTPSPCDPDIFERGEFLCVLDGSSNAVEALVREAAEMAPAKIDWHYVGGRAVVLHMGNRPSRRRAMKAIKTIKAREMLGRKFGRLTVLSEAGMVGKSSRVYLCRCDCGAERRVERLHLLSGNTQSCGCLSKDVMRARATHGKTANGQVAPEYRVWKEMLQRCMNPRNKSFRNYAGRGIAVCERWLKFANFYADMGPRPSPRHSIDRRNNDGNYEPGNCRWATKRQQVNNTRIRRNNTSGFPGVSRANGHWVAHIRNGDKQRHLGSFPDPASASRAYEEARMALLSEVEDEAARELRRE